ncbi:MAG: SDR family NAD(P)-dependent oxidoreductase, partial [Spirochaetota bacterium]
MTLYNVISGASSGLGLEIARELVFRGEPVCMVARNREKLVAADSKIHQDCPSAQTLVFPADISSEDNVRSFYRFLSDGGNSIRRLFNVAGTGYYGSVENITADDISRVMNPNLTGLILMTVNAVCEMKKDSSVKNRRIINVMSTAALGGKKNESIYY